MIILEEKKSHDHDQDHMSMEDYTFFKKLFGLHEFFLKVSKLRSPAQCGLFPCSILWWYLLRFGQKKSLKIVFNLFAYLTPVIIVQPSEYLIW